MSFSKSCRKLINSTSPSHQTRVPLSPPTLRDAFTPPAPSRPTNILFVALSGLAADLLVALLIREGRRGKGEELRGYEMVVVVVIVVVAAPAAVGGGGCGG